MIEPRCRILICDDHAVTRHGLRLMAETIDGVEVVGEAETGGEALEKASTLRPDLVMMDLDMPEMGGLEAIRKLKAEMPEVDVLVLTVHEEEQPIFDAIASGAAGYLAKSSGVDEIRGALVAVRAGGGYITPAMAGRALRYVSKKADDVNRAASAVDMTTPREREILALLGKGLSARRIATRLSISERTVNTHVGHIYRRLGVNNRVDAVREGMRLGLVESPR